MISKVLAEVNFNYMNLHKSLIGTLGVVVIASGIFGVATPAQAATTNFSKLEQTLELLRGNMLRLKDQMGSSTKPFGDRKLKNASSTKPTGEDKQRRASSTRAVDQTCMQEAVNTREEAIMNSFETFTASTLSAMEKRQAAFAAAWTDSTIKNTGKYNGIWTTWKKDTDAARKQLNKDRVAAWKAFRTTAKESCKATLPKAESETQEIGTTAI